LEKERLGIGNRRKKKNAGGSVGRSKKGAKKGGNILIGGAKIKKGIRVERGKGGRITSAKKGKTPFGRGRVSVGEIN